MKIVYDNIVFNLQRYGGVSVVWGKLITLMRRHYSDFNFIEYEGADKNNNVRNKLDIPADEISKRPLGNIKIQRYKNINEKCSDDRYIFHSSYFRISNDPKAINITTVHDFTYEIYVNNPLKKWVHVWQKHNAIRKSDFVVCISENTKRDLLRFVPNVPEERIRVIYNGVSQHFSVIDDIEKQDFVLFVGRRDKYKNFNAIINPLAELGKKLVIVGDAISPEEKQLMDNAGLIYEYLGIVDDEGLNKLYNQAYCLLYPSLYEGFGLPILEAQMVGCPVLAHEGSSITEIIGDERSLLKRCDTEEFREKFAMLDDKQTRASIIANGIENAKKYTWERMAEEYAKLYQEAYDTPPVTMLFRNIKSGFSIHKVFKPIISKCKTITVKEAPRHLAGLGDIILNLRWIKKNMPKCGIIHMTGGPHYFLLALRNRKTVLTVHDLVWLRNSKGLKHWLFRWLWFKLPIAIADKITCISDTTKRELENLFPESASKTCTIYNPVAAEFSYCPKQFNADCPRILHVGTAWNKNTSRVIEALKDINCKLVIVGKLTEEIVHWLKEYHVNHENLVDITDEELATEYQKADIISFPSIFEGFGMPIIEGQTTGRPVLTSNIPPMTEIAGDAACFVSPYDTSEIREGFLRIINDEAYRNELISRGLENAKRFDANIIAEQYNELYKTLNAN